jgi:nucleotidyltransferase substrate binding protein (TIGR01987 family)
MSSEKRWIQRFANYEKALKTLSKIVKKENKDELEKMALIKAFEFTFELGWKTLKDYLIDNGFEVASPKETIRQAFQAQYISDGSVWIEAIDRRNESAHAYEGEILDTTSDFVVNRFYHAAMKMYNDFKAKI